MAHDQRIAIDEMQRVARHEELKEEVGREVKSDIKQAAQRSEILNSAEAAKLGSRMQHEVIDELSQTHTEIHRGRLVARISQVLDFIFLLIYGIISLEILLDLIGARETNPFREFVHAIASPFLAPFVSLVPDPSAGRFQFRISFVVALVVYALVHVGIGRLLKVWGSRVPA